MTPQHPMAPIRAPIETDLAGVFAANLVRLREARGWSIRQASQGLGVAASTWSQWESGKHFPPAHLLMLLPLLFGVPICRILGDCEHCARSVLAARDTGTK